MTTRLLASLALAAALGLCWGGCSGLEGDGDADSDADIDTDIDTDVDGDGDSDADGPLEGCIDSPSCARASDCSDGELCVFGACEPARWDAAPGCSVYSTDCIWTTFPDPCYAAGISGECPSRAAPHRPPHCSPYLELGRPGPADDALVLRLLHDLWSRGQASGTPNRPKVIMAVGDSISMTMAYLTDPQWDCELPDIPFDSGYRVVGQSATYETVQTALEGQTADWGVGVLSTEPWFDQIRPEVAPVMFGTNELWSGYEGLQQHVDDMRQIVDLLLAQNVIPILMTIPPGTYGVATERDICGEFCTVADNYETEDFAQAVRDLAAERLLPLVDVHRLFVDFDRPGWEPLLADDVHPCLEDCPPPYPDPTGTQARDDLLLRMYKYLEAHALTRCPGSAPPPEPEGYSWNDADVLANFRGASPASYCPDPAASCP